MEPGSPLYVPGLFKKPHKWSSAQLVGLQIEQHDNVDIAAIVGRTCLPMDDDPLFKSLAADFAGPEYSNIQSWHGGPFCSVFWDLWNANMDSPDGRIPYQPFDIALRAAVHHFLPFHLASLHIRGELNNIGVYYKYTDLDLPLAIFVGRSKGTQDQLCSLKDIVPYILFQAILKHERDTSIESHGILVVSMKGTTFQFNKGVVSKPYLEDLLLHKVPSDPLTILRSGPYNLIEQDGRREYVKAMLGLIQNDVKHLGALRVLAFDDVAPENKKEAELILIIFHFSFRFWRPNGGYLSTIENRRQPLARQRLDPSNQDEESYLLTVHGTQLRLVTAYFTADYLRHMKSTTMPVNQFLFVKRSRFYEVKEPCQRVEAPKLFIGLFRPIMRSTTLEDKITLQKGARRVFDRGRT
ncbi:hypothetical protein FQN53_007234 [Emmonsiellopsis sp. PD_33]|nr:hypothetical protein FQN53_007234 [Emmonsiellopsis sp. PD_33]